MIHKTAAGFLRSIQHDLSSIKHHVPNIKNTWAGRSITKGWQNLNNWFSSFKMKEFPSNVPPKAEQEGTPTEPTSISAYEVRPLEVATSDSNIKQASQESPKNTRAPTSNPAQGPPSINKTPTLMESARLANKTVQNLLVNTPAPLPNSAPHQDVSRKQNIVLLALTPQQEAGKERFEEFVSENAHHPDVQFLEVGAVMYSADLKASDKIIISLAHDGQIRVQYTIKDSQTGTRVINNYFAPIELSNFDASLANLRGKRAILEFSSTTNINIYEDPSEISQPMPFNQLHVVLDKATGNAKIMYQTSESGGIKTQEVNCQYNLQVLLENCKNLKMEMYHSLENNAVRNYDGQLVKYNQQVTISDFDGKPDGHVILKNNFTEKNDGIYLNNLEYYYCITNPSGEKVLKNGILDHSFLELDARTFKEEFLPDFQRGLKIVQEANNDHLNVGFYRGNEPPTPADFQGAECLIQTLPNTVKIYFLDNGKISSRTTRTETAIQTLADLFEARKFSTSTTAMGKTATQNIEEVVAPSEPVEIADLLTLFDQINFTDPAKPGYRDPSKLTNDGEPISVEKLRQGLATYVNNIKDRKPLLGVPENAQMKEEWYNKITPRAQHIVLQLNQMAQSGQDLDTVARCLITLGEAGHHCGSRFVGETWQLFSEISKQGEAGIQELNTENVLLGWMDQIKLGVMKGMIDPTNSNNAHEEIFFQKALFRNGVKIPGGAESQFHDPFEISGQLVYKTEEAVVNEFYSRMTAYEIIETIHSQIAESVSMGRGNDALAGKHTALFMESLQIYTEENLLNESQKAELKAIEDKFKDKRAQVEHEFKNTPEYSEKMKKLHTDLVVAKSMYLDPIAQELGLYKYDDDTMAFEVTKQGVQGLLLHFNIISRVSPIEVSV